MKVGGELIQIARRRESACLIGAAQRSLDDRCFMAGREAIERTEKKERVRNVGGDGRALRLSAQTRERPFLLCNVLLELGLVLSEQKAVGCFKLVPSLRIVA